MYIAVTCKPPAAAGFGATLGLGEALRHLHCCRLRAFVSRKAPSAAIHPIGDGGWSWFGDPRAVTYTGAHTRTYVGWVDLEGDIKVSSYDHDTGDRVTATLQARLNRDDHANPSMQVRPDGRLVVYYSRHVGPAMHYRVSSNPEDVDLLGRAADRAHQHARHPRLHLPQPDPARRRGRHLPVLARRQLQPHLLDPAGRLDHLVARPHAHHDARRAAVREVRLERRRHHPRGVHERPPGRVRAT